MGIVEQATKYVNRFVSGESFDDPRTPEHQQRAMEFKTRLAAYRSDFKKQIKVKKGGVDYNVSENWTRSIVNDGISFLFGGGLQMETDNDTVKELWADRPLEGFSFGEFLTELAQNGALSGTAYIRLHRMDDGRFVPKLVSPEYVDIIPSSTDATELAGYDIIWRRDDKWYRKRIERNESSWVTLDQWMRSSGEWQTENVSAWGFRAGS